MKPESSSAFSFMQHLNEQQRAAVLHTEGASLIVAGAGSGKTTVLTARIAYLISKGVDPMSILALTFTNKAAREMKERVARYSDSFSGNRLWMGTFHSIFSRILRQEADKIGFKNNYTIYKPSETKSVLRDIVRSHGLDEKIYKLPLLAERISQAKNMLVTPSKYKENVNMRRDEVDLIPWFHVIYEDYFNRCRQCNVMDFDDLLLYTFLLFAHFSEIKEKWSSRFKYVLVDEYQDTNLAQFAIMQQLVSVHGNVCVVGDDAQSIYGFRGARIENILSFSNTFEGTEIFKLERNYRSTKNIVNAANSLIKKNNRQLDKNIFSVNEEGDAIVVIDTESDREEAEAVCNKIKTLHNSGMAYKDMAILYRTNGQSSALERALGSQRLPFVKYGGNTFFDNKEIRDAMAYFRLIANKDDEEAFKRIVNYPTRGIGNTSLQKIIDCANENNTSLWNVASNPDLYGLSISKKTKLALRDFVEMIDLFADELPNQNANVMVRRVLSESGLLGLVISDMSQEGRDIHNNLMELENSAKVYVDQQQEQEGSEVVTLYDFLSDVALQTDTDNDNADNDSVSLMTIHNAKGLEFDVVFITGMNKNLFPSMKCVSAFDIEEERRLMFVAITRAKKKCFLTTAKTRFLFGKQDWYEPSCFLNEIDPQYLRTERTAKEHTFKHRSMFADYEIPSYNTGSRPWNAGSLDRPKNKTPLTISTTRKLKPISSGRSLPCSKTAGGVNIAEGDRVRHASFGCGMVVSIEDSSAGIKAAIRFDHAGEKKLLLKYAKLEILK